MILYTFRSGVETAGAVSGRSSASTAILPVKFRVAVVRHWGGFAFGFYTRWQDGFCESLSASTFWILHEALRVSCSSKIKSVVL